ncbi:MAG: UDP-N-acetylglucosamine diphosphorylase/glucosamine-1-phosphate N-acetyltransferase [Gammaproteobacteria bacterium RIFCSPHIGHO2_12_FULL_45_9]|nr:MAG: UDP-N-acetylglucosamine diphosphorylase/glucosamine-1-phosphate N-acetyltransferase [Gammaproteobacteria bacterium RIFCSPHIGHO2_12_FULL_45_9]
MGLSVVILAAGKGKRMASGISKVLHPLAGVPLLERVVKTAQVLSADTIHVVYGRQDLSVRQQLKHLSVNWVEQIEPLGTGHALLQAMPFCKAEHSVLVLYGDVPLISVATLQSLLKSTASWDLGLVVATVADPSGLGRILRDRQGRIVRIVEQQDATAEQLAICEINTGIMIASAQRWQSWLPRLNHANQQKEYYLTDVVAQAVAENARVGTLSAAHPEEVQGVNDRWELSQLERYYQHCMAKRLALAGVTLMDPNRLDVRGDNVHVDSDVTIDVGVILMGKVRIGKNTRIGPHVVLQDVVIGESVEILANSVIDNAHIGDHCRVGPFARIRPGTVLETGSRVGNFVEVKNTTLGAESKANHLAYLGDAQVGARVNIGAGTITCNYDGVNKWPTTIHDDAFIGSNTALVAPLIVEKGATIGAGSTITENAPADCLTLARVKQCTIEHWSRPTEKKKSE